MRSMACSAPSTVGNAQAVSVATSGSFQEVMDQDRQIFRALRRRADLAFVGISNKLGRVNAAAVGLSRLKGVATREHGNTNDDIGRLTAQISDRSWHGLQEPDRPEATQRWDIMRARTRASRTRERGVRPQLLAASGDVQP